MPAIKLQNLTKTYPATARTAPKTALNDVNLAIPQGSIFGLLGPNGAGKSTLINILAGTVIKTSGKAEIMGVDIDQDMKFAKTKIGVVPQELVLDTFFPVREALEFYAGYYGIRPKDRKTDEILTALGLQDKANVTSRQLSGGMKRRFLVAKAMVHSPQVLILDEPTAGVDLELREQLWDYVVKLNKQGTTIILTTHYLEEAEKLCDQIAFINHGKLIKHDSKANLLNSLGIKEVTFTTASALEQIPNSLALFNAEKVSPNQFKIRYSASETSLSVILAAVSNASITINDLYIEQGNLEHLFKQIMKSS